MSSVTQSCAPSQKHLDSFPSSSVTGRNCLGGMHKCLIPMYSFIYGILKVVSQAVAENETFVIVRHDGTCLSTQHLRRWSRRVMNLRAGCVTWWAPGKIQLSLWDCISKAKHKNTTFACSEYNVSITKLRNSSLGIKCLRILGILTCDSPRLPVTKARLSMPVC